MENTPNWIDATSIKEKGPPRAKAPCAPSTWGYIEHRGDNDTAGASYLLPIIGQMGISGQKLRTGMRRAAAASKSKSLIWYVWLAAGT